MNSTLKSLVTRLRPGSGCFRWRLNHLERPLQVTRVTATIPVKVNTLVTKTMKTSVWSSWALASPTTITWLCAAQWCRLKWYVFPHSNMAMSSGSPQVCLTHTLSLYAPLQLTPGFRAFLRKMVSSDRGTELWVTSAHGSNVWDIFMYCNSTAWWDTKESFTEDF